MLLGPALDLNDSMTAMLIAGSEHWPQPYNYSSSSSLSKPNSFQQSLDSMSATLEPSAMDISPRYSNYGQLQFATSMAQAQESSPTRPNISLIPLNRSKPASTTYRQSQERLPRRKLIGGLG